MSDSVSSSGNNHWIKFAVCCVWIALAIAPEIVDLNKLNMQVNVHGAVGLISVAIQATSPIALIWLFVLLREAKGEN